MISPLEIAPPKNWQDFEMLCLKLWGEIWNIPHEIEFNSDNSQGQQGVDIYGIPKGETYFFGIQCKNKKLNLINGEKNRITTSDIDEEISNAITFRPQLKKLIIATSLNKDAKIEEYVRLKTIEHLEKNLFPIQICFWEFFQRKIIEYRSVSDWYLKNENFLQIKKLKISIDNNLEKSFSPKFKKIKKTYLLEPEHIKEQNENAKLKILVNGKEVSKIYPKLIPEKNSLKTFDQMLPFARVDWEQYCWFKLQVNNIGQSVIEDYKIELEFVGEFEEIGVESPHFTRLDTFKRNTFKYSNSRDSLVINPLSNILVQNNYFFSNDICIKPLKDKSTSIELIWKAIGRDFQDSGKIQINIEPKYVVEKQSYYTDDPKKVGEEVEFSLIKRNGTFNIGGKTFFDKESDYNYE